MRLPLKYFGGGGEDESDMYETPMRNSAQNPELLPAVCETSIGPATVAAIAESTRLCEWFLRYSFRWAVIQKRINPERCR